MTWLWQLFCGLTGHGPYARGSMFVDGREQRGRWCCICDKFWAETTKDPRQGKQCGACSREDHKDCSGWCFCPQGPCDPGCWNCRVHAHLAGAPAETPARQAFEAMMRDAGPLPSSGMAAGSDALVQTAALPGAEPTKEGPR